jgi:hypothetical protein
MCLTILLKKAQTACWEFRGEGISQGRRPEFTGGGLGRGQGEWSTDFTKA